MTDSPLPVPLHASAGRLANARGRLLLVSYHFPPLLTTGAVRWARFAEFAAERGWSLDVIAADPAEFDDTDGSALERLPPGTRVFGVPRRRSVVQRLGELGAAALSLGRMLRRPTADTTRVPGAPGPRAPALSPEEMKRKGWDPGYLRRGFLTLAADRGERLWARDAFQLGVRLSRTEQYRLIISCGPPHMAHEAGRRLSEHTAVPFVMDLRDPWSLERRLPQERAHPLYFKLARRHEARCVQRAELVVANTDEVREAMQQRYASEHARFLTVRNGYDELDLPPAPARRPDIFKITYAGAIYLDRNPEPLFRAVHRAVSALGLTPRQLAVELIGGVSTFVDVPTAEIAARCGIGDFVHLYPPQKRNRLWAMLRESSMLVSLPWDSPWAIPSKVYEYMQFDAWLLILAHGESPTARLLRDSGADVVSPSDVSRMAEVIVNRYREHARGGRPARIGNARFSRRHQAARLFDALEDLVKSRADGRA